MRLEVPIEGVRGEVLRSMIVIRSEKPLKALSSAVFNGGFRECRGIINCQVKKSFRDEKPEFLLGNLADKLGLRREAILGLLTAVKVKNVAVSTRKDGGLSVTAVVTAGLSNASTPGDLCNPKLVGSGTINIITLIDGNLSDGCLVNAITAATEAKASALRDLDIRSRFSSGGATGTTSDSIVVASTGRGGELKFAGPATKLGELIGLTVREAVKEAIIKEWEARPGRALIERLEERGIRRKDLVDAALRLYIHHPSMGTRRMMLKLLEDCFEEALSDPNVAALVLAGLRLEEDGEAGLIPRVSSEEFKSDPVYLLADEILGLAISNYIAGSRGVFEFIRFDKAKPGLLKRLGPFLDDAIGGLIAGASSNMYTRALSRK